MSKKTKTFRSVEIIDIANKGQSVGKSENGIVLMVKNGIPGDIVDIETFRRKKNYYLGNIIKYHSFSSLRTDPKCEHFGICGGCKWQNMIYNSQVHLKEKKIKHAIQNISQEIEVQPIIKCEEQYYYRNKLEFSFTENRWLTNIEISSVEKKIEKRGVGFHISGMWDKVIDINQKPIGRTPRSNPATYTGVFTFIRDLFAQLPESKIRGYKPGRFSFNVKGGRCESCEGDGIIKIEMNFLPDVYVTCEVCKGARYNRETLEIKYKNKNIAEILNMSVEESLKFFANIPQVMKKLTTLNDVGLGYIRLGQQATTLSGGEAQRIKLSTELSKSSRDKTFYILDEPTTGLHFEDVKLLLGVLQRLVDKGNTVVVIEHNLDIIKSADWIIDLGPEGGVDGGDLIFSGTPEEIIKYKHSYTGQFLKQVIKKKKVA